MKTSWNFSLPWESRFLPLKESNKLKKKEKGKHNSLQKLTHSFLHLPPLHHIPYSSSHLFIFSREKKNKTENIHTLKFLPYGLFHDGVHVTIVPWIPKKQIPKAWHSAKRETMRILSARVLKLITRTAIGRWSNECPPPHFSPSTFLNMAVSSRAWPREPDTNYSRAGWMARGAWKRQVSRATSAANSYLKVYRSRDNFTLRRIHLTGIPSPDRDEIRLPPQMRQRREEQKDWKRRGMVLQKSASLEPP